MRAVVLFIETIFAFFIAGFAFLFATGLWIIMQAFEAPVKK